MDLFSSWLHSFNFLWQIIGKCSQFSHYFLIVPQNLFFSVIIIFLSHPYFSRSFLRAGPFVFWVPEPFNREGEQGTSAAFWAPHFLFFRMKTSSNFCLLLFWLTARVGPCINAWKDFHVVYFITFTNHSCENTAKNFVKWIDTGMHMCSQFHVFPP